MSPQSDVASSMSSTSLSSTAISTSTHRVDGARDERVVHAEQHDRQQAKEHCGVAPFRGQGAGLAT